MATPGRWFRVGVGADKPIQKDGKDFVGTAQELADYAVETLDYLYSSVRATKVMDQWVEIKILDVTAAEFKRWEG